MGSIRMKNNLGLAGKAFIDGKIVVDSPKPNAKPDILITEEMDLKKLSISSIKNALAIPVMDK